jgi:hypothetical protein
MDKSIRNWNPEADQMRKDKNGIWTKVKMLSHGNNEYKFWVDGERCFEDAVWSGLHIAEIILLTGLIGINRR